MRWLIPLALLPLLAACSERQMCISRATKDLRQVQRFAEEAEGNLRRGYAIEERQYVDYDYRPCGRDKDGDIIMCRERDVETRRVPKSIDLDGEAAKLRALRKKEAQLQTQANAAVAACVRQYPE
ncbi:hypothetical protein [Celeribacter indicus]|uniref:Lipoprotein n=1 Tax=Celeribacter indicus TaxID=1208324 RepID=A0A0B5E669_9RHOB|nr:hypothetical protein [Celeribacter indicus]AJE48910.1 hypothetical protein P73_4195 [Celeribacter indicus]SDW40888.1 hypothetical protein SAMN05443573_103117 [Celeribacter indicus]